MEATKPTPQESWSNRSSIRDGDAESTHAREGIGVGVETSVQGRSMVHYTSGEREFHRRYLSVKVLGRLLVEPLHKYTSICIFMHRGGSTAAPKKERQKIQK